MMKEPRDNGTLLPGLKPVLELMERDPEKVDVIYVRKGRSSADSDRLLDLCRDYGVRFQLVGDDVLSRMAAHVGHQGVINAGLGPHPLHRGAAHVFNTHDQITHSGFDFAFNFFKVGYFGRCNRYCFIDF